MESQRRRRDGKLEPDCRTEGKKSLIAIPIVVAKPPTATVYKCQLRPDADIPVQSISAADRLVVGIIYTQHSNVVAKQHLGIARIGAIKEMLHLRPHKCRPIP